VRGAGAPVFGGRPQAGRAAAGPLRVSFGNNPRQGLLATRPEALCGPRTGVQLVRRVSERVSIESPDGIPC
jgi:hypothetical protein